MSQFQVHMKDHSQSRIVPAAMDSAASAEAASGEGLADGEVLLHIERFAFTSNNITYAVAGDQIGYWKFFPPIGGPDAQMQGWGVIPVWGFATVSASKTDGVEVGERLFGYLPPADTLTIRPVGINDKRLIDGSSHRAELPPTYNSYARLKGEPDYDPAMDANRMLLWPLHVTSFCLWDAIKDADWYGAKQIVILSASSKTSIGLAYALDGDESAPPVRGITSAGNVEFVKSLDLYDSTVSYAQLEDLDTTVPTVIVDMSGDNGVLSRLHTALGDNMKQCVKVGLTHWEEAGGDNSGIIKARSHFFFAPSHVQKRIKDWGADGFQQKTSDFLQLTAKRSADWMSVRTLKGLDGLAELYDDILNGKVAPNEGLIVDMDPATGKKGAES